MSSTSVYCWTCKCYSARMYTVLGKSLESHTLCLQKVLYCFVYFPKCLSGPSRTVRTWVNQDLCVQRWRQSEHYLSVKGRLRGHGSLGLASWCHFPSLFAELVDHLSPHLTSVHLSVSQCCEDPDFPDSYFYTHFLRHYCSRYSTLDTCWNEDFLSARHLTLFSGSKVTRLC